MCFDSRLLAHIKGRGSLYCLFPFSIAYLQVSVPISKSNVRISTVCVSNNSHRRHRPIHRFPST